MKNFRILISGASGFIGSNLSIDFLKKGQTVIPISLRNNWIVDPNIDVYIHLAGIEKDTIKNTDTNNYINVNSHLTLDFFHTFVNSDAKKFIFFSSSKAVLDSSDEPITESQMNNPKTDYGKSKLLAEELIQEIQLPAGKKLYILRPCLIHGQGDRGNLKQLFNLVTRGIPWPLGSFENKRSFCSIDNLMFIVNELIVREDIPSGIYNVADDVPLSTNELIGLIAQSQHRKAKVWKISSSLIEKIARIGDKFRLPLNSERLQKLTSSYVVSNAKIKAAIGKPLPVSSRDGLMKTFQSFQKN
jgi:nucleoside-diphosphate-sugar epimerase